jgi:hypothetical protein
MTERPLGRLGDADRFRDISSRSSPSVGAAASTAKMPASPRAPNSRASQVTSRLRRNDLRSAKILEFGA